jgi:hypothetical protein
MLRKSTIRVCHVMDYVFQLTHQLVASDVCDDGAFAYRKCTDLECLAIARDDTFTESTDLLCKL